MLLFISKQTFLLFLKTSFLKEEVNRTEPVFLISVSFLSFSSVTVTTFTRCKIITPFPRLPLLVGVEKTFGKNRE
jgi:hypothetical protein